MISSVYLLVARATPASSSWVRPVLPPQRRYSLNYYPTTFILFFACLLCHCLSLSVPTFSVSVFVSCSQSLFQTHFSLLFTQPLFIYSFVLLVGLFIFYCIFPLPFNSPMPSSISNTPPIPHCCPCLWVLYLFSFLLHPPTLSHLCPPELSAYFLSMALSLFCLFSLFIRFHI